MLSKIPGVVVRPSGTLLLGMDIVFWLRDVDGTCSCKATRLLFSLEEPVLYMLDLLNDRMFLVQEGK